MQPLSAPCGQRMIVKNDHDVISLRQAVRQMARAVGLGLPEQARITAAISEIARLLLSHESKTQFTIRIVKDVAHPALEVLCTSPYIPRETSSDGSRGSTFCAEARSLVDENSLFTGDQGLLLTLRMWIHP